MKQLKSFLPLIGLVFCSAAKVPKQTDRVMNNGNDVLLVYTGTISSKYLSFDAGIHFEMDPSVGMRYEVVYEKGSNVLSHIAIFYKFSSPYQTILYDFLTHQSTINFSSPSSDEDKNLDVIETSAIGTYNCTHLQKKGASDQDRYEATDFWMSKQVPGFPEVLNALKKMDPDMLMGITQAVFKWGGLVKVTMTSIDKKRGETANANIELQEANSTMSFNATNFDVPKK